jgi:cobalamin biosynthesis Co2+ chelatase CbiK
MFISINLKIKDTETMYIGNIFIYFVGEYLEYDLFYSFTSSVYINRLEFRYNHCLKDRIAGNKLTCISNFTPA